MSSPLIHVPRRKTEPIDFVPSFTQYIHEVLSDDSDKYADEIRQLNRYREDAQGAGKDLTGRDLLYRYYGQLELLDLRFQFGEQHLKIVFKWYDAFSGQACSQYSPAFEKASIIFNLGSVCSGIASLQNRADVNGLKIAYNYFQAAAGMFQFINDNFLHAPSVDMSRDSIKVLTELMLSQAQECFLEKVLSEKKKGMLVAKLASHLSASYSSLVDGLSNPAIKGQFDKTWIELSKIKGKYFQALACQYRAEHLDNEGQYGESVAYSILGHQCATDAKSLADSFSKLYPYFSVSVETDNTNGSSNKTTDSQSLVTLTTMLLHILESRKTIAVRDNDMIYHQSVPDTEALPQIEKLNAVKPIPFADLLPNGQADIPTIVGPDLFKNLVPLSVTESSSMYSEEKAQILRTYSDMVEEADQNLHGILQSLDIDVTLNKVKAYIKSSTTDSSAPGEMHSMWADVCSQETQDQAFETAKDRITAMKTNTAALLNEISLKLDQEQHECENYRVKYLSSWSQEASANVNEGFRNAIKQHRVALDDAATTDRELFVRISTILPFIKLFSGSFSDVSNYFTDQIMKDKIGIQSAAQSVSLLDETPESGDQLGSLGEQVAIQKMDALLQRLNSLKEERKDTMTQLRKTVNDDDISSLLLFHRGKESQVFQAELSKFTPLETKLSENVKTQSALLDDLRAEFDRLKNSSFALKIMKIRESRRKSISQEWQTNYKHWTSIRGALNDALEFYHNLQTAVTGLQSDVNKFITKRKEERDSLVESIQKQHNDKGQEILREQLRRLSLQSTTPTSVIVTSPAAALSPSTIGNASYEATPSYVPPLLNANPPHQAPPLFATTVVPLSGFSPSVPQALPIQPQASQPYQSSLPPFGYNNQPPPIPHQSEQNRSYSHPYPTQSFTPPFASSMTTSQPYISLSQQQYQPPPVPTLSSQGIVHLPPPTSLGPANQPMRSSHLASVPSLPPSSHLQAQSPLNTDGTYALPLPRMSVTSGYMPPAPAAPFPPPASSQYTGYNTQQRPLNATYSAPQSQYIQTGNLNHGQYYSNPQQYGYPPAPLQPPSQPGYGHPPAQPPYGYSAPNQAPSRPPQNSLLD